jgi:hypothetical protein
MEVVMRSYESSMSAAEQNRLPQAEQLVAHEPQELALEGGRVDVFTGSSDNFASAEDHDDRHFSIIDLRDAERDESGAIIYEGQRLSAQLEYLIIQPGSLNWDEGKGFKGLRAGEVVDMGRASESLAKRFNFSPEASRKHMTIAATHEGTLLIADNESSNGTSYRVETGAQEAEESPEHAYYRELFARPGPQGRDRFGNDLDGRLKTTEQSLQDATMAYRFADADVKDIVRNYTSKDAWREEDMAKLVQENEELRTELGIHLLTKLHEMTHLPGRFSTSETKNPNYRGYRKMTSHEYAAVLALSMLDGTFKKSQGDSIESDYGEIIRGQHRWGAHMALGNERLADVKRIH